MEELDTQQQLEDNLKLRNLEELLREGEITPKQAAPILATIMHLSDVDELIVGLV